MTASAVTLERGSHLERRARVRAPIPPDFRPPTLKLGQAYLFNNGRLKRDDGVDSFRPPAATSSSHIYLIICKMSWLWTSLYIGFMNNDVRLIADWVIKTFYF